jgi:hypothetical protein
MSKNDKTINRSAPSGRSPVTSEPVGPKRKLLSASQPAGTRLQLPPGEAEIQQLRSVTREWLVPRLVEKFLRVHGVGLKHTRECANRLQPSLLREDSDGTVPEEARSQVKKKNQYRGLK